MKSRSFGVTDALILIAAVAAGLCVNRTEWPDGDFALWRMNPYEFVQYILSLVLPHAAALTAAALAIRLRRPRATLRHLARQPGVMACEVALAALLVVTCWAAFATVTGRFIQYDRSVEFFYQHRGQGQGRRLSGVLTGRLLTVYGDRIGFAVTGAWLSLWLFGRWRPERAWIDRLCRGMGWIWLSLTLVVWLGYLLL